VTFDGAGQLVLQDKAPSGVAISGFAGADRLDLAGFALRAGETLSFVENKAKTSGTLTVTDGALQAGVTLFGNYAAAGFHMAGDRKGGTVITYGSAGSGGLHADLAIGHG
jgi:hypothetical protein